MRRRTFCAALALALLSSVAVPRLAGAVEPAKKPATSTKSSKHRDLRVGVVLAGGAYKTLSDDIAAGLAVALAAVERGIDGHKIKIVREDGDGSPGAAAARAKALLAGGPLDVLIGPSNAAEIPALREMADKTGIPLLVPVAQLGPAAACSPYVVNLVPPVDQVAGPLGAWFGAQKPAKNIYFLAPQDAAARSQVAAFQKQFVAAGGAVVGEEYVSGANLDFSPYLAKLRLMGADAIYAPFTGEAGALFAKEYEAQGLQKQPIALVGAGPSASAHDPGAIWVVDYLSAVGTPENRKFVAEYSKRFRRSPTEYAARGYDAGRLIIGALRAARGRIDDRAHFLAALTGVVFEGPRGPVRADPRRSAAVDRLYIVRALASPDGSDYQFLDRLVPQLQTVASCPSPQNG